MLKSNKHRKIIKPSKPAGVTPHSSHLSTRTSSIQADHPHKSQHENTLSRQNKTNKSKSKLNKNAAPHGILLSPSYYAVGYTTDSTVSQWGSYAPIRSLPMSSTNSMNSEQSLSASSKITNTPSFATPRSTRSNISRTDIMMDFDEDTPSRGTKLHKNKKKVSTQNVTNVMYDTNAFRRPTSHYSDTPRMMHTIVTSPSSSIPLSTASTYSSSTPLSSSFHSPSHLSFLSQQLSTTHASISPHNQRRFFSSSLSSSLHPELPAHHTPHALPQDKNANNDIITPIYIDDNSFPTHVPLHLPSLLENIHSTKHSRYTSPQFHPKVDPLLQLIHVNNIDKHIDYIVANKSNDSFTDGNNHHKINPLMTNSLFNAVPLSSIHHNYDTYIHPDHIASLTATNHTLSTLHEDASPHPHPLSQQQRRVSSSTHNISPQLHASHQSMHTNTPTTRPTTSSTTTSPSLTDHISSTQHSYQSTIPPHRSIVNTFSGSSMMIPNIPRHTLSASLRHFSSSSAPSKHSTQSPPLSVSKEPSQHRDSRSEMASSMSSEHLSQGGIQMHIIAQKIAENINNPETTSSSSSSSATTPIHAKSHYNYEHKNMQNENGNHHEHHDAMYSNTRPVQHKNGINQKYEDTFTPLVAQTMEEETLANAGVIKHKSRDYKVQTPAPSSQSCEHGLCVDVSLHTKSVD